MNADELVAALLTLSSTEPVCILDSSGVGHLGSHLLIAGIDPVNTFEISNNNADETLRFLDEKLSGDLAAIFTLSYDFGLKLVGVESNSKGAESTHAPYRAEPDVFITQFDVLIVHDYDAKRSFLAGNVDKFDRIGTKLNSSISDLKVEISDANAILSSSFTKSAYIHTIEQIKERIRYGDTYQTNLTQQITAHLPPGRTPETIFRCLRRDHPSPFAALIRRSDTTVISASPERFFKVEKSEKPHISEGENTPADSIPTNPKPSDFLLANARAFASDLLTITTSPIKGTRRRGNNGVEDEALKRELLSSDKDRAENIMIVDLLRNDLGRVCEYGSVEVEKLCSLEAHPSLFHLVSTVNGRLRRGTRFSDILRATFPCGSITGAPKRSTMSIIDEIEPTKRGLSMGAIGYSIPNSSFGLPAVIDLSVAIRTMVIREQTVIFNVGGGIVIDSDPESEYDETLTKAKSLLDAIGVDDLSLRNTLG